MNLWCKLFERPLASLSPLADFIVRAYLAFVFFQSGLTKIQTWESTLDLFAFEYTVPILPPEAAAYLATGIELVLPVLLLLGLLGRLPAFILLIFNALAWWSYPFLWTPAGHVGWWQHIYWGMLLMLLTVHGTGKWALDRWLFTQHQQKNEEE